MFDLLHILPPHWEVSNLDFYFKLYFCFEHQLWCLYVNLDIGEESKHSPTWVSINR